MTKNQKALAVRALRHARGLIAQRRENYICCALSFVSWREPRLMFVCGHLQELISKRLEDCITLEGWLIHHAGISSMRVRHVSYRSKIVTTRLAWIDSLIEEFS